MTFLRQCPDFDPSLPKSVAIFRGGFKAFVCGSVIFFGLAVPLRSLAQEVILHLRNGDRIAGKILSENTNEVVVRTVWIKELHIPAGQIDHREISTTPGGLNNLAQSEAVSRPGSVLGVAPATAGGTNKAVKEWSGEIAVGTDIERGATEHQLYYGRAKISYAHPYLSDAKEFFKNVLTYDVEYGETAGTLSDNRMNGSLKTDLDLSRRFYAYNLGGAGYDRIRLINLQIEEGPGLGYHWFNHTNFQLNLEAGANYQVQNRQDNASVDSFYYRLAEDLTWKINQRLNLTEKYEYFPRSGYATQFRMRFESNVSYAILLHLSLNLTLVDFYDTQPAATIPDNDFQLRTSIGVKF